MELHELASTEAARVIGNKYNVDVEAKRKDYWGGTNEGCNHINLIWTDAKAAYPSGKAKAYFLVGIMLHMIEDMGVPAHAKGLVHQAPSFTDPVNFDNFECMSLTNWNPNFNTSPLKDGKAQEDPRYDDPSEYYAFSKGCTLFDAPNYNDIHTFSKTWSFANLDERQLMMNRQGRTCIVTYWALNSACNAFLH